MRQFLALVTGPMGAGKTTTANLVHARLPGVALIGRDRIKWFVSHFDRTPEENRIAMAVLLAMLREYLEQGVSVIVDEGLQHAGSSAPFFALAEEHAVALFAFRIEAPREVLLERIARRPLPEGATRPVPEETVLANLNAYFVNRLENPTAAFDSASPGSCERIAADIVNILRSGQNMTRPTILEP
jgi:predicted kinase